MHGLQYNRFFGSEKVFSGIIKETKVATMTCEKCKKVSATYHLTSIENGQKKEAHLCEACAKSAGVGFSLDFSLSGILGEAPKAPPKEGKASKSKCPNCGMTIEEFKKKMRIGCANDYELFKDELKVLLQKIHGASEHVGKAPAQASDEAKAEVERAKREAELAKLRKELDELVKAEKYEEAAKIRDTIRETESKKQP